MRDHQCCRRIWWRKAIVSFIKQNPLASSSAAVRIQEITECSQHNGLQKEGPNKGGLPSFCLYVVCEEMETHCDGIPFMSWTFVCCSLLLLLPFLGMLASQPHPLPHTHTFSRLSLLIFSSIAPSLGTLPVKVQILSLLHTGCINSQLFIHLLNEESSC